MSPNRRVVRPAAPERNQNDVEPRVGIFWLFQGKLILDSTPLSKSEIDADFVNYATGHDPYWAMLQRQRIVPHDVEYSQVPRGRVGYYRRQERFWFRADPCILKRKNIVQRIKEAMNLPRGVLMEKDDHYRCPDCKDEKLSRKQEEEDWDF